MRLLKQPNKWSCSVTSLAMVLGCKIDYLMNIIGHDGSEVIHPDLPEPLRRRGFHLQELIDAAMYLNYRPVWIELLPVAMVHNRTYDIRFKNHSPNINIDIAPLCEHQQNLNRFKNYLNWFNGIILGEHYHCCHWVAWNGEEFYDPNGTISKSLSMDPIGFLAISNHR